MIDKRGRPVQVNDIVRCHPDADPSRQVDWRVTWVDPDRESEARDDVEVIGIFLPIGTSAESVTAQGDDEKGVGNGGTFGGGGASGNW